MDIPPLPTIQNKTTSSDVRELRRGDDAFEEDDAVSREVDDAFEEELLAWLGITELESYRQPESETLTIVASQMARDLVELEELQPLGGASLSSFFGVTIPGASANAAQPPKPVTPAPIERVTEEQLNVRKLVHYLDGQRAQPTAAQQQAQQTQAGQKPEAPAANDGYEPLPELEPDIDAAPLRAVPSSDAESDGKVIQVDFEGAAKRFGFESSSAGSGFRHDGAPSGQAIAQQARAEAGDAAQRQMSAATQRLLADARERALQSRSQGKLSLTLVLEEATVPMRMRFSPSRGGGHEVAFVVTSQKSAKELEKLMSEIETALTELPVEVSEVKIEVADRLETVRPTRSPNR